MSRQELNSDTMPIEQLPPISGDGDRNPDIILVDKIEPNEYLEALAFNEEPVTIRIEPGIEENAPLYHPAWVNGRGAEVLINNRWVTFNFLPVGEVVTTKRKYLEVLLRSKRNSVITVVREEQGRDPVNEVRRPTSATMAISIIEDRNPRASAWIAELRRRNY